jgi:hypothetical protein
MTVDPLPGICIPRLAPAKGFETIWEYIGLEAPVSPGESTPAPYNFRLSLLIFQGVMTGFIMKDGFYNRASSVSPFCE